MIFFGETIVIFKWSYIWTQASLILWLLSEGGHRILRVLNFQLSVSFWMKWMHDSVTSFFLLADTHAFDDNLLGLILTLWFVPVHGSHLVAVLANPTIYIIIVQPSKCILSELSLWPPKCFCFIIDSLFIA